MNEVDDFGAERPILGRYRIVWPLARGGQGAVYLARGEGAEGFARPVVVKRILAPWARDPQVLGQFAREARITAQLRHPGIVPIIDFARDGDSHIMVLEYVHGYDLRRWERFVRKVRGHFPPEHVLYPVLRVLDALQYAHTLHAADGTPRGVIHRDISPANVLIDVEGHVKLTDFGIARMADEELTVETSAMKIKGKLPYLAPEIFLGERASERTDLYACGVVLHELLSGRNEFLAATAAESMARVTRHVPTRLSQVRSDLSEDLCCLAERALAKDPAERFQSAQEMASALRAAFDLPELEMALRFRRAVRDDFHDPRLAQMAGVRTLIELDSAWRTARSVGPSVPPALAPPLACPQPETLFDVAAAQVPVPRPAPGRRLAIAGGLAALIVAVAAVWLVRARTPTVPRFVYVETQEVSASPQRGAAMGIEAPSPAAKAAPTAAQPPAALLTATVRDARVPSTAEHLTRTFARRGAEVAACFSQHRQAVLGKSSLQVQFATEKDGRVRSASLVPPDLTQTPFGRCVLRIAASTRFGAQPRRLAFRIPITARQE